MSKTNLWTRVPNAELRSWSRSRRQVFPLTLALVLGGSTIFLGAHASPRGVAAPEPAANPGSVPLAGPALAARPSDQTFGGFYSVRCTGVATGPVRAAAARFLATLSPEQQARSSFPDRGDDEGDAPASGRDSRVQLPFRTLTRDQRDAATDLIRVSLTAGGLDPSEAAIKLKTVLSDLEAADAIDQFTVLGQPMAAEPWEWQFEGHHLIVNYYVLGDEVVMIPTFLGPPAPLVVADHP